jgi:hypothetical protein
MYKLWHKQSFLDFKWLRKAFWAGGRILLFFQRKYEKHAYATFKLLYNTH